MSLTESENKYGGANEEETLDYFDGVADYIVQRERNTGRTSQGLSEPELPQFLLVYQTIQLRTQNPPVQYCLRDGKSELQAIGE